jgi:hypothetical protein
MQLWQSPEPKAASNGKSIVQNQGLQPKEDNQHSAMQFKPKPKAASNGKSIV